MESKLSQLLANHDFTERQLLAFDESVTSLSQRIFSATNQSDNLRLLLRLSVTEGVQDMYAQFHNKNKLKVLDGQVMEQSTAMWISPTHRGNTKADKAAEVWTSAICEFYRGS